MSVLDASIIRTVAHKYADCAYADLAAVRLTRSVGDVGVLMQHPKHHNCSLTIFQSGE